MINFDKLANARIVRLARSEGKAFTSITAPTGQGVRQGSNVQLTVVNNGDVTLGTFKDWDVVFEIQENPGLKIANLTYTENASPSTNEWTVQNIYVNGITPLTTEVANLGTLNPDEKMVILANPSPTVTENTHNRATFSTPNGVLAQIIFEVYPFLYVVDETDATAYKYAGDGTYLTSSPLDGGNDAARGITTDDTHFWTTDLNPSADDTTYKYTSAFSLDSSWNQVSTNKDSSGITTDDTNIWIVDGGNNKAYKYDMNGSSVSNFGLAADNHDATGITTDGTNIWVVDEVDDKAYKYDMVGISLSDFALTANNDDPQGITTDGVTLWVVDSSTPTIYRYTMTGTYMSEFALSAANADPQGLTMGIR